ncbi:MAG: SCO family protein [Hymenobacteraceae bacterium]|nr:SCO family protein [Hymenobacteraceae bacterium]
MSKFKALILGLLLLVPIFVFIFISTFGEHHFSLRTYFPERTEAGEVVYDAKGDTVFHQVADFRFLSQQGDTVSQSEALSGALYVAGFSHISCPESCQKKFSQLVRVQEAFEDYPSLKILSFMVSTSENHPVEVMKDYASTYSANPEKWFFLTGSYEDIANTATQDFFITDEKVVVDEHVVYSERFFLVDKERRIRGIYNGTDPVDVDRMILEVNVLLDEYSKSK